MSDEIIIPTDATDVSIDAPVNVEAANAETDKLNASTNPIFTSSEVAAYFEKTFCDEASQFANPKYGWRIQSYLHDLPGADGELKKVAIGFQVILAL
jgi:hypothetical protein